MEMIPGLVKAPGTMCHLSILTWNTVRTNSFWGHRDISLCKQVPEDVGTKRNHTYIERDFTCGRQDQFLIHACIPGGHPAVHISQEVKWNERMADDDEEGKGEEKLLTYRPAPPQALSVLLYTLQVWWCGRHLPSGYSLWLIFLPSVHV